MKLQKNPRLLFAVSMVIFGTIGLFVRNIPVSSGELALYRAVLATVTLGAYLLLTKQALPLGKIRKALPLLILSGILPSQLFFPLINGSTIVLSSLVSVLVFKEKLTARQTVGLVGGILSLCAICILQ